MKCPKCNYLGFDTGDRCRNCGYDFSLLSPPSPELADVAAVVGDAVVGDAVAGDLKLSTAPARAGAWDTHVSTTDAFDRLADAPLREPSPVVEPGGLSAVMPAVRSDVGTNAGSPRAAAAPPPPTPAPDKDPLPLFSHGAPDDVPLVTLPASPRAPLAVRRAPDSPKLRSAAITRRRRELDGEEELELDLAPPPVPVRPSSGERRASSAPPATDGCAWSARAGAALLDVGILLLIDWVVFYFTLRMAALGFDEWRVLPIAPLLVFLVLVKVGYYWAFTAIGGQTIGKMAAHIRVVSDEGFTVAPACAFRRTLVAVTAIVTCGATFLPALFAGDGRAMHDRLAHTRVVALPGA